MQLLIQVSHLSNRKFFYIGSFYRRLDFEKLILSKEFVDSIIKSINLCKKYNCTREIKKGNYNLKLYVFEEFKEVCDTDGLTLYTGYAPNGNPTVFKVSKKVIGVFQIPNDFINNYFTVVTHYDDIDQIDLFWDHSEYIKDLYNRVIKLFYRHTEVIDHIMPTEVNCYYYIKGNLIDISRVIKLSNNITNFNKNYNNSFNIINMYINDIYNEISNITVSEINGFIDIKLRFDSVKCINMFNIDLEYNLQCKKLYKLYLEGCFKNLLYEDNNEGLYWFLEAIYG